MNSYTCVRRDSFPDKLCNSYVEIRGMISINIETSIRLSAEEIQMRQSLMDEERERCLVRNYLEKKEKGKLQNIK